MKTILLINILLCTIIFTFSCKKEKDIDNEVPTILKFDTLYCNPDTVGPGGQTQFYAVASGNSLTFTWSADLGDIIGSGSSINFMATPCMYGTYTVTCKVKDSSGSEKSKDCLITIM